ncbi:DNA mismatch repair endonuclease MutL, partial [Lactobacillus jensenii]
STDGIKGVKAEFAGGEKLSEETHASTKGTEIKVSDLFYNTPARLKYLKSPRTETMKIVDIVNRLALGHSEIAFTLKNEGKLLLKTPGNNNLRQDLANIYGRFIAKDMIEFSKEDPDFKVSGLLSTPETTRSNRNFVSILLNGRYIKNYQLTKAILAGYGSKIAQGRYPIAVILIELDPFLVDVNVHPTKEQVRLSKEKELSRLITEGISTALLENTSQVSALANLNKKVDRQDQLAFNLNKNVVDTTRTYEEQPAKEEKQISDQEVSYVDLNQVREDDRYVLTASWDKNVAIQVSLTPFTKKANKKEDNLLTKGDEKIAYSLPYLTYCGQVGAYLLASNEDDLYLIDQVSAERALKYCDILKQMQETDYQQTLLTPLVLDFGSEDYLEIKNHLSELREIGLILEDFGQNSLLLPSYPLWLKDESERNIRELLDLFLTSKKDNLAGIKASLAKAEVKRRVRKEKLTKEGAQSMLEQLASLADPYYDPFGQLIIVKITDTELDHMFKKGE